MFEVKYYYHERLENNEYDKENVKEVVKKIGSAFEEVPLEKLASKIISELARRDIWVINVEVNEFVKKPISFKETKGGIVLKNKKFLLDGTVEIQAEPDSPIIQKPNETITQIQQPQIRQVINEEPVKIVKCEVPKVEPEKPNKQVLRWEVLDPDPSAYPLLKNKRVTIGKKYPIMSEDMTQQRVNHPQYGPSEQSILLYVILDDAGKEVKMPCHYFTPELKGLLGVPKSNTEQKMAESKYAPSLSYIDNNDIVKDNMPNLRRR